MPGSQQQVLEKMRWGDGRTEMTSSSKFGKKSISDKKDQIYQTIGKDRRIERVNDPNKILLPMMTMTVPEKERD